MNPKIIYPLPVRQSSFYRRTRSIALYSFVAAGLVCVILNLILRGKPWSLIVVWSLFSVWQLVFSLKLVEYSIFSHLTRIFVHAIILLWIIDHFIAPGWAQIVIPIVFFGALTVLSVFYYITYDRKHRHLISIMILGVLSLINIPLYLSSWPVTNYLALAFQIASTALLLIMIITNWKDLLFEIKVRFKAKNR